MPKKPPYKLRASEAYWDAPPTLQKFLNEGVEVESVSPEILMLIKELDRRFIQLWDKVNHERL